jgi:cytidylate kinase
MARITVSGACGSGKTTLSRRLAKLLGYTHYYAGGIHKEEARKRGMPIEEYYASIGSTPEVDIAIDDEQKRRLRTENDIIVEGRIAPFLAPEVPTIRVFLDVAPPEGARRQLVRPENAGRTIPEVVLRSEARVAVERERYRKLYGIEDHMGHNGFEVVVDTTNLSEDAVFNTVLIQVNEKLHPR